VKSTLFVIHVALIHLYLIGERWCSILLDSTSESNSASVYRASQAELVKACRHAKKELRQHRLYLDQLLAIVIERHPEVLTMVTEAQNMRDLLDSESWC
jgi:hypothetical protein